MDDLESCESDDNMCCQFCDSSDTCEDVCSKVPGGVGSTCGGNESGCNHEN